MTTRSLFTHPVHLGLGARVVAQPAFTGMEWYAAYAERHAADGTEGRLVSCYTFAESWNVWEMHPQGDELVLCVAGQLTLHQEDGGGCGPRSRWVRANMRSIRRARGTPPM